MIYDRLKDMGQILSDSTRVDTLRIVASSPEPVSAQEIAAAFGLHPNAARHHLAKLESVGLVKPHMRRNPAGGRPAKLYSLGDQRIDLVFPSRNFALLAALSLEALSNCSAGADRLMEQAGRAYGRRAATLIDATGDGIPPTATEPRDRFKAIVSGQLGSSVASGASRDRLVLTNQNCLFKEVSKDFPAMVCGLCRGVIAGIGDHFGLDVHQRHKERIATGDERCSSDLSLK